MSASSDLTRGEIAYDGYHALDETYTPFSELPEDEQWRWAQAGCNAGDAWAQENAITRGGLDAEHWRQSTRAAHAHLRTGKAQSAHQQLINAAQSLIGAADACEKETENHPSSRSAAPVQRYIEAMNQLREVLK